MTATPNLDTQAVTFTGVYAVAVLALGHHMHTHQLPLPNSVDFPLTDGSPLVVFLNGTDHPTWLTSVHVDVEANTPTYGGKVWTTWDVRLPDTGTRLRLKVLRDVPFTVAAVS